MNNFSNENGQFTITIYYKILYEITFASRCTYFNFMMGFHQKKDGKGYMLCVVKYIATDVLKILIIYKVFVDFYGVYSPIYIFIVVCSCSSAIYVRKSYEAEIFLSPEHAYKPHGKWNYI